MKFFSSALIWVCCLLAVPCAAGASEPGEEFESIFIVGVTEPIQDLEVAFSVSGIVDKVNVEEGDWVKKGQQLLALDSRVEEIQVRKHKLVSEDKTLLTGARTRLKTIESLYLSNKKLFDKTRSISEEEVKRLGLELDMSRNKVRELQFQEDIERIEYEMAREVVAKRKLSAPIEGVIVDLPVLRGEPCESGKPVVRIIDPRKCRLICNVDAGLAFGYEKGQPVVILVSDGRGEVPREGIVEYIAPDVDPSSGLVKMKIIFDNTDLKVRPGASARFRSGSV